VRARLRSIYPALRITRPAAPAQDLDPLHDVMFASQAARAKAEGAGLTFSTFAGSMVPASSERGYTAADVRAIIALVSGGTDVEH
jgi:hypothetical protein